MDGGLIMRLMQIKKIGVLLFLMLLTLMLVSCRTDDDEKTSTPVVSDPTDYEPDRIVTETKVRIYEGPKILESSDLVEIKVEGKELFVYETLVNHGRIFSYATPKTKAPVAIFDFEGSVDVEITINGVDQVHKAVVRPLAYGVEPTLSGNTISFTLDYPTSYVIEYNDDPTTAIHLFANPLEEDAPDPNQIPDDMIYIGPGVYKADAIPVKSNQTVYIAGGAVVYGQIRAENVENVTIRGRGIIDGSIYKRTQASEYTLPIEFRHSKNIKIEGIAFLNPAGWAITSYFVDGLEIDNIKIITARANGDGISIQSSKNVTVRNSFVRSWDDSLVVKNYDRGNTENILFENMVIWTDLAQSMEIGYEAYGDTIKNVTFRNITVLHNFHKPVISIHNADDAAISNILYQNITVEDAQMEGDNKLETYDNFLIDFTILYNQEWTSSGGKRGTIYGVTIDNVVVLDGRDDIISRIIGYDKDHRVTNVKISNVVYKGTPVRSKEDLKLSTNEHTDQIRVTYDDHLEHRGARLILPYLLDLKSDDVKVMVQENITQEGYLVPEFARREIPTVYNGKQITGDFEAIATHGTSVLEWDDGTGSFTSAGDPNDVLDGDRTTGWIGLEWNRDQQGDYAALTIYFNDVKKLGMIKLFGDPNAEIYLLQNIAVYGIRATSNTDAFTKILNAEDYEFSPATGNVVNIKINPGEYKAIQLRFYNRTGLAYPNKPFAYEVEFYPASLTYNKTVYASEHEDVYVATNLVDGNPLTYYESKKNIWPAEIVIDMGEVYEVNYIIWYLPPLLQWETRQQDITILMSIDGINYTTVVPETTYTFDPLKGNLVEVALDVPYQAQYVKFIVTKNTSLYGAQFSEIEIYE